MPEEASVHWLLNKKMHVKLKDKKNLIRLTVVDTPVGTDSDIKKERKKKT
jgi:hypothetical protein